MTLRRTAQAMADELAASELEVALIPAPSGRGKVREAVAQNPLWYQRLCAQYSFPRHTRHLFQTIIKRQHTLLWLRRIAAGPCSGTYVSRLLPVIQRVQKEDAEQLAYERKQYRRSR